MSERFFYVSLEILRQAQDDKMLTLLQLRKEL